jgi:SAM-dependent MidA family methyltransferase
MTETTPLERHIRDRIRTEGPITFAAFMEAALYDPDEGFYANPPVGETGDFVTSPHVSPAFGVLLARCVEDLWVRLGRPDPFLLIEAAAGDGTLARRLLASLPRELAGATTFIAVERSAGAREALLRLADDAAIRAGIKEVMVIDDIRGVADVVERPARPGVVLANELLDNLPFHRVRGTPTGIVELRVGIEGDQAGGEGELTLVEAVPTPEVLSLAPHPAPGQEAAVAPAAFAFIDHAARALDRGYVLLFDYAADPDGSSQVHGYRRHRVEANVLRAPGTRDITAGVDFGALERHARQRGLIPWGPVTQRAALTNLGLADWGRELRTRQAHALNEGRGADATRFYSARNSARLLVDPAGLGGFAVLCLGVGDPPRPGLLLDGDGGPNGSG